MEKRIDNFKKSDYYNIYILGFTTLDWEEIIDIIRSEKIIALYKIINKIDYVYDELGIDIEKELKSLYLIDSKYENVNQLIVTGNSGRLIKKVYPKSLWNRIVFPWKTALYP